MGPGEGGGGGRKRVVVVKGWGGEGREDGKRGIIS